MSGIKRCGTSDAEERLNSRTVPTDSGCHLFGTGNGSDGYGKVIVDGKFVYTHRLAYEMYVGPIPKGYELDHLCRIRHCMNPTHLELVDRRTNTLRGRCPEITRARFLSMTSCKWGHPFSGDNLYVNENGHRKCRACSRQRARVRRALKAGSQSSIQRREQAINQIRDFVSDDSLAITFLTMGQYRTAILKMIKAGSQ